MKLGQIKISNELLREDNIKTISPLFAKFTPLFIDRNKDIVYTYYCGYCDEFEEVKEGLNIPLYDAIIRYNDGIYELESINKV